MVITNQNSDLKRKIKQRDIEFSNYAQEHGLAKAFDYFCSENIIHISGTGSPTTSKTALIKNMKKFQEQFSMRWEPSVVSISTDGETGVTKGEYQLYQRYEDGSSKFVDKGHYLTIWRKNQSGTWKAIYDMDGEIFFSP